MSDFDSFQRLVPGEEDLRRILGYALDQGADFADIFLEARETTRLEWQEGSVKSGSRGSLNGVGVRAVCGGTTGYATTCSFTPESIEQAARAAGSIAGQGGTGLAVQDFPSKGAGDQARFEGGPVPDAAQIVARLELGDQGARASGPDVAEVGLVYVAYTRFFTIVNSEGVFASERQDYGFCQANVLARKRGLTRAGRAGRAMSGNPAFLTEDLARTIGREGAEKATRMLEAREVPAGPYPVVFAPGDGAILFHEAVGHSLEGDIVLGSNSVFAGSVGESVASPGVTLVDDAGPVGLGGSFGIDDEGTPAGRTVLIEGGVLRGFLHDRASARRSGSAPTGNGRRQDFRYFPIPRMTNTFLEPGDRDPGEILESVKEGLYVRAVGAGQSNTNSGGFTFQVLDADWIEGGKCVHPACNASLVGDAFSVLGNMDMIGRDFAFGRSGGWCGKGQLVPVEGGMPTVRVKELVIGGKA